MSTPQKDQAIAEKIYQEVKALQESVGPKVKWSYFFVQHPNGIPIVNYDRVFFWQCESAFTAKHLYSLVFQEDWKEGAKHYDIIRTNGYLCMCA